MGGIADSPDSIQGPEGGTMGSLLAQSRSPCPAQRSKRAPVREGQDISSRGTRGTEILGTDQVAPPLARSPLPPPCLPPASGQNWLDSQPCCLAWAERPAEPCTRFILGIRVKHAPYVFNKLLLLWVSMGQNGRSLLENIFKGWLEK